MTSGERQADVTLVTRRDEGGLTVAASSLPCRAGIAEAG